MEQDLITRVNELQDIFNGIGGESVDLPQIVTVGSQSSGKSSVLENIVGKDFLPRGSGIVTRRPLVLQLIHLQPSTSAVPEPSALTRSKDSYNLPSSSTPSNPNRGGQNPREYAEFLHNHQRYYDFNEVRREIENETKRVTGANKGISNLPIHLKLYSERVTNLTLVDLPGLTKIPVGDQPTDIEKQIRSLVLDYISKPNCIILAISPANVDLANSDSLKLARQVDPEGRRTLGVLTKLDLMDSGTNAIEILTGRIYPLKLGFIGVVNRSQQDINTDKPMDEALAAEEDFFKTHPAYRLIAHRCGTKYLTKTLNNVLLHHIRDRLPDLKARLNTLIGQTQQELAEYGDIAYMGDEKRGSHILSLINSFAKSFKDSIDGTSIEQSTTELVGGARVLAIFDNRFGRALESINPMHNLSASAIAISMKNSTGARPSFFMPETTFIQLVKPQIQLLEPPALKCVDLVYEELMKLCHGCTSSELARYPRLHSAIIEVVSDVLRERLRPTLESVRSLIQIQVAYINTKHPSFTTMTTEYMKTLSSKREQAAHTKRKHLSEGKRSSDIDEKSEGADSEESNLLHPEAKVNGRAGDRQPDGKLRTASMSIHDRHSAAAAGSSRHVSGASISGRISPVPFSAPGAHASNPNGAKDAFLNYFFGNNPMPTSHQQQRRSPLPDLSEIRSDNPLSGRRGMEGSAAALDMKSLDKHLDASVLDEDSLGLSDLENSSVPLLQSMITAYFSIVRQTIQDLVPKAIMHYLVNATTASVQTRLVENLYQEAKFGDLLQEDENTAADRNRVKATLDAYKEAFKKLTDYP